MKIKLAVNRNYTGKLNRPEQKVWRHFNGSFQNVELEPEELIKSIQSGFSYTAQHREFRKAPNFVCAQLLVLDFDTEDERSTLAYLAQDDFISRYATFLHTTPSHTSEKPRGRAIFVLDRPIYQADKFELLTDALLEKTPTADKSCRDCTRFYYGAVGCEIVKIGNILTLEEAGEVIVKPYRERVEREEMEYQAARQAAREKYGRVSAHDDAKTNFINSVFRRAEEKVRLAGPGERHHTLLKQTRHLAGYLNASWVPIGMVSESRIKDTMMAGSIANGEVRDYGELNSETTIRDGIQYGVTKPYDEPVWKVGDKGEVVAVDLKEEFPAAVPVVHNHPSRALNVFQPTISPRWRQAIQLYRQQQGLVAG